MTTTTTMYAAYDDQAIWGVGETPEAALQDADDWRHLNLTPDERAERNSDELTVAPCTPALAKRVEISGGNVPFAKSVGERGQRVLCTPEEERL